MRIYPWHVTDPKSAQKIDWTDYLRSQGIIFPHGGFACYLPSAKILVVANTPEELDLLNPF